MKLRERLSPALRLLRAALVGDIVGPLRQRAGSRVVIGSSLALGVCVATQPGSAFGTLICFLVFFGLSYVGLALAPRPRWLRWRQLGIGLCLFLGLLLPSLVLRLPRLSTGLPYAQLWDEPQVLGTALRMFKTHDLDPHFFAYPSLSINLQYLWMHVSYALMRALGQISSRGELLTMADTGWPWTLSHPTVWYMGRLLHTLLALGSIAAVYRVGIALSRRGHRSGAALAASLLAANVMLIEHSTIGTVDSVTAFFSMLWALALVRFYAQPSLRSWLWLAIAAGLLCSCKYNAGVVIFPTLWAVIQRAEGPLLGSRGELAIGTLALSALGFFIGSPAILVSPWAFLSDMTYEFRHYAYLGHEGAEIASRPAKLLHDYRFFLSAFPVPHTVAAMGLWFWLHLRRQRHATRALCLFAFPLLYIVFMGMMKVTFVRNFVLVMPFLCLFCGQAADELRDRLAARWPALDRVCGTGLLVLCVFVLLPTWRGALAALPQVRLRGEDTRSLAMMRLAPRFPGQRLAILAELHVHPEDLARAPSELAGQHSGPLVVSISDLDGGALRARGIRWLLTTPSEGLGSARGQQAHQHLLAHCPVENLSPGHTLRPDVPIGNPQLFLLDLHGCSDR